MVAAELQTKKSYIKLEKESVNENVYKTIRAYFKAREFYQNGTGRMVEGKRYWGRPRLQYVSQIIHDVDSKMKAENKADCWTAANQPTDRPLERVGEERTCRLFVVRKTVHSAVMFIVP